MRRLLANPGGLVALGLISWPIWMPALALAAPPALGVYGAARFFRRARRDRP